MPLRERPTSMRIYIAMHRFAAGFKFCMRYREKSCNRNIKQELGMKCKSHNLPQIRSIDFFFFNLLSGLNYLY